MECDYLLFACPSHALRDTCKVVFASNSIHRLRGALALCKGLEPRSNLFSHEVMSSELGPEISCGYLTGPSHAEDIASGKPAAMVLAIEGSENNRVNLQSELSSSNLRIYRSNDLVGVALGSCLKNVYAIATGISDGLGLGDNARAALLTRSMSEIVTLGNALGAVTETFLGLSGFGDLVATCMGKWSRNRNFGRLWPENNPRRFCLSRKPLLKDIGQLLAFTTKCKELGVEMPILSQVYSILYESKEPATALCDLMQRDLRAEVVS